MSEKNPWFKLYAKDLLADENLKTCSMAARGMFIYMLSLMHRSGHRGHLCQINNIGKPMDLSQLSLLAGCETTEAERLVSELLSAGVFAVSGDRIIYSRRMVREERVREARSKAGAKGGKVSSKLRADLLEQNGKQNPSNGLSKMSSKPLGMGINTNSFSEEEKEESDLGFEKARDGGLGEGILLEQNAKQNPSKTHEVDSSELSPAWLAEKYLFVHKGFKGRSSVEAIRGFMEEMVRFGIPAEEILKEIDSDGRDRTEPIWKFQERLKDRIGLNSRQSERARRDSDRLEAEKAAKAKYAAELHDEIFNADGTLKNPVLPLKK